MRRLAFLGCACVAGCLSATALHAGAAEAGFDVSVQVVYGEPKGPERLRREIQLELIDQLTREGCFASVRAWSDEEGTPASDLLLRVRLDDLEDRMTFDSSLAQRTSPNAVPQEEARRVVAALELNVRVELLLPPQGPSVRRRSFHLEKSYRPLGFEDPRYEVEQRLTSRLVRDARAFVCKGSGKRLQREVARAQAAAR